MNLLENTYTTEAGYSPQVIANFDDIINEFNRDVLLDEVAKELASGKADLTYEVAIKFLHGESVRQDAQKAIELFKKASESGNPEGYYGLFKVYMNGIGTEKNEDVAIEWFARAIQNNSINAKLAAESCGLSSLYAKLKKEFNFN